MIAEYIMSRCGWDAVWYLGGDPSSARYLRAPGARWWHFLRAGACLVGEWTGPDMDLLCVRQCDSAADARRWLSPPGRFVLDATLRSLWVRWFGQEQQRQHRPAPGSFDDEPPPDGWEPSTADRKRMAEEPAVDIDLHLDPSVDATFLHIPTPTSGTAPQRDLAAEDERRKASVASLFASQPWKLVERHSPLCGPEIAELRQRIEELG